MLKGANEGQEKPCSRVGKAEQKAESHIRQNIPLKNVGCENQVSNCEAKSG